MIVSAGGRDELVTAGNQLIQPTTPPRAGAVADEGAREQRRPVAGRGDGVVVFSSGYPSKIAVAVRPGGTGDITGRPQCCGATTRAGLRPLADPYEGFVYLVTDKGLITCLDAQTGEVVRGRALARAASLMASPVALDGHLLLMSQDGDTFVVKAGPRFEVVRTNPLGEPISASAALPGGRIYIRGEQHLFAIAASPRTLTRRAATGGRQTVSKDTRL